MEAQIFQKVAQNVVTVVFTLEGMFLEYPNKWPKRLDTFEGNFVSKNFKKSPNLVTLVVTERLLSTAAICGSNPGIGK